MTTEELKKIIAASNRKTDFDKQAIIIELPYIDYHVSLIGIVSIYDYFTTQLNGFKQYQELPEEFSREKDGILRLLQSIVAYINNPIRNEQPVKNYLRHFKTTSIFFPTETKEFNFLMHLFLQKKEYYNGAFNFFTGQIIKSTSRDHFIGSILAFDFYVKDVAINKVSKDYDEDAINTQRNQLQEKIGKAQQQLTDYLAASKQQADIHADSIKKYKEAKEKEYGEWFATQVSTFGTFTNDSFKKITDLEQTYRDKLKLEAPAKYWNDRATQLRKEGYRWLSGLITAVIVGIVILVWILNMTADGTIKVIFSETSTAVKWSIALITLISFLAYIIRVLAKLTFSSFHLVRDAEEREQLTYIYLALQNESKFDATERHLIMQSLFSRADTGLLKDDASPTMPGNIIDHVIKK